MTKTPLFTDDLERFGPTAEPARPPTLAEARAYCRQLAMRHYENFSVATRLLPKNLRQHFCNVYAYCRWADDLADETGDPQRSLELLDWWAAELKRRNSDASPHPVFVALRETIREFEIPIEPFEDLLVAFRQDQRVTRYETFDELLGYCRNSANPVGRLVLHLGRCCTADRVRLSDSVCTGLQLANFYQDVARDYRIGRIYLPMADCREYGYTEADFAQGNCNDSFRRLLAAKVDQAEGYLRDGLPLVEMMPGRLRLDVALFAHGGLAILDAIRRQDYDVWSRRPVVSKMKKLQLLAGCWWRR